MEEERGGKRSRGASVARAVTRWAHISPMLYYFENVNTNKRHGPVTNSSQRIIILGGREIMVKRNKMLKCSIMGNPHIASWPPSAAWSSDVLSSTSQQHCLLVHASGPGLTWPLSSPQNRHKSPSSWSLLLNVQETKNKQNTLWKNVYLWQFSVNFFSHSTNIF